MFTHTHVPPDTRHPMKNPRSLLIVIYSQQNSVRIIVENNASFSFFFPVNFQCAITADSISSSTSTWATSIRTHTNRWVVTTVTTAVAVRLTGHRNT